MPPVVILGCGYVGQRVARMLAARGLDVLGTTHDPTATGSIRAAGAIPLVVDADRRRGLEELRGRTAAARASVVLAVPPGEPGPRAPLLLGSLGAQPARVVYLSSASVYGTATRVDERTPPCPLDATGARRLAEEAAVASGPWSWLTLRAAAIYGPGRGILADPPRFGRGLDAVRSRIHVEDLAALTCAALGAHVQGAFPAADDDPASPRDMLALRARLRGLRADPEPARREPDRAEASARPQAPRIVDGRAVRLALGVQLRFRSYRDALAARPPA